MSPIWSLCFLVLLRRRYCKFAITSSLVNLTSEIPGQRLSLITRRLYECTSVRVRVRVLRDRLGWGVLPSETLWTMGIVVVVLQADVSIYRFTSPVHLHMLICIIFKRL